MNFMMAKTDSTSAYVKGVDGLRALAVLAVMLFHIDPSLLPGGFSGVDVFFVISGYVISSSLARNQNSNFFHYTANFYAKRAIRILPALIVCLLVTSIFTTLFIPDSWLSSSTHKTGLYAYFGLSNYALVWYDDGYFSPRIDFNPYTHTWSLGVEEQFYLFFPLILFIWIKYKDNKDFLGAVFNWLLTTLLFISLFYSYHETSEDPSRAYYLLPSRFWELACGALLFKLHFQKIFLPTSEFKTQLFLLAGITLVGLGFAFSNKVAFPFPWAILSVSGTVFVIAGLLNKATKKTLIQGVLEGPFIVYIGKISYSLYLWHWPVYVLLRWTSGMETLFEKCVAFSLALALANISYYYIEKPIRKNNFTITHPSWFTIAIGVSALIVAFQFSKLVHNSRSDISLSVTQDMQTWYPHEWPSEANDRPKVLSGRKLFVLGDSHTGAYSTMLKRLSDEYGVKIIKFSNGGCGAANLLKPLLGNNNKCAILINKQLSLIESSASAGDILFLASLRMNRFGDQWALFPQQTVLSNQFSDKSRIEREEALTEAENIIKRFEKLQMHIVIDAPKPIFKSPPFRCSDWFNKSNPICASGFTLSRNLLLEHRKPVMESLQLLSDEFPSLVIWDPFPILCNTDLCSAFDKDKPLFFDGDHLSAHGNRVLYPYFLSLIKKIWAADFSD